MTGFSLPNVGVKAPYKLVSPKVPRKAHFLSLVMSPQSRESTNLTAALLATCLTVIIHLQPCLPFTPPVPALRSGYQAFPDYVTIVAAFLVRECERRLGGRRSGTKWVRLGCVIWGSVPF
jgi:hypothetical protein